ncbi:ACTIVATING SIGNAL COINTEGRATOR 1 COMPLEX SUBUNIT 1 [Salix koriyanagi]|uniref:ACTIVATING SIGNAL COINTEGRATOR 1 COMPLEX SUBUNIT 1 n=1 Tax=Salix koriyanagi TaxID=2511006 RepID=A0A9Q0Q6A2_9ROSI|nr:ACTIVATING SIGNAL COINTEGRATOR 1 COMPLEX SUBUNIT 1 [Salix koriyanagi]
MIACSSRSLFFGVDCALKYANPYLKSNPLTYFERISGVGKDSARMDRNKKLKSAVGIRQCQWRPVSVSASNTQGSANELDGDKIKVAQVVTDNCDSTISAGVLDDTVKPMLSSEKHSLSLEAPFLHWVLAWAHDMFSRFEGNFSSVLGVWWVLLFSDSSKGKEGSTQKKIEEEMGVKIVFPSSKKEESIVIEGISTDCVTRASEKIQAVMDEAIESSLDYSHFMKTWKVVILLKTLRTSKYKGQELIKGRDVAVELKVEDEKHVKVGLTSIPLVSYPLKPPRLPNASDFGIDKSIFIKPTTFHLTVIMLKLWNKERVNAASGVLKSISSKVIDALDNQPIFIKLKGLDTMRGSLSRARVLYAPVEEIGSEGRLLRACQVIINAFVEAGLVLEKDAKQKLKLHATVMNARHRKGKRRRKNDSFDARGIFKQFGSEDWGEYLICEAHLSQRFVYDENGFYHCCASIPFPGKEERKQTD